MEDQNVHGGRGGFQQGTAAVIGAGGDKVGEDVVGVGSAQQLSHRQAKLLCQVSCQNVAEVSRGHGEIHLLPHLNHTPVQQIPVGAEVVDDLRGQTANVDGVGAGQSEGQLLSLAGGENLLHPGLGIVKVAPDGADVDVAALLGDHLGTLHLGHAAVGVEYADAHPGNVVEALQGGFAGVAGGSGEDADLLLYPQSIPGGGEQLGQHGQRHVLECGGGATEQLQYLERPCRDGGGQVLGFKFSGIGPVHQLGHIGDIRQQGGEDGGGHVQGGAGQAAAPVEIGQSLGHVQPAVRGKSFQHGLGAGGLAGKASGGMIQHMVNLLSAGAGAFASSGSGGILSGE